MLLFELFDLRYMLRLFNLELVELAVNVLFRIPQLCLGSLRSLLTLQHVLVVYSQALKFLNIRLNFRLLRGHFRHLDVELFDRLLHLLALL